MARLEVLLEFPPMSSTRTVQSPLLVGPDEQLASADRCISDAAAGNGRFRLLAGETGVGKPRLVRSILMKARAAGFRVAKGDVNPQDTHVLLAPVHDLARTMGEAEFGKLAERLLAFAHGARQ